MSERLTAALADRYRIERELGQGGMATVYLAQDIRHDRKVALKVLRPELAAVLGADRFVVEIKTTAALQHPHILPLFDSGSADGFLYYVMPFIEGETLRSKLDRETQLGVEESVRITTEVADALDYAHRHGVIHRDIKPENILLHDGRPMVADFGIALAVSAAAGGRMTETGLSLGTPHYMSPEQATAEKELTARSDIYSLGSVLYEMLAGQPPHLGGSAQQVIMKIVTDTARPLTELRKSVPPNVAATVATALEKLPADRFESARAFRDALLSPGYQHATTQRLRAVQAQSTATFTRFLPWMIAAAAVIIAVILGFSASTPPEARATAAVIPLQIRTPNNLPLNEVGRPISLALDGSFLVFVGPDPEAVGSTALWYRSLERLDATPIAGTSGAQHPQVMPDGKSVQFLKRAVNATTNERWEIGLDGGLPTRAPTGRGLRRLRDGRVLVMVGPAQGEVMTASEAATRPPGPDLTRSTVDVSRDGRWIAMWQRFGPADSVVVGPPRTKPGGSRIKLAAGVSPLFLDDDLLAFRAPDGTLQVGRLRADRTGFVVPAVAMVSNVSLAGDGNANYAVGDDGTLIYMAGGSVAQSRVVLVADGKEQPVLSSVSQVYGGIRAAPDSRRAAVTVGGPTQYGDIWILDLAIGSFSPLTTDGLSTRSTWRPDGKTVSYLHTLTGLVGGVDTGTTPRIYQRIVDGARPPETLQVPSSSRSLDELDWSPDGNWAALRIRDGSDRGMRNIYAWRTGSDSLIPFATEQAQERGPRISPDGKWLIYVSDRSGRDEIYAESFPGGGHRAQLSTEGGREAVWSRDGRQVFFRALDGWMTSARVNSGLELQVTGRTRLFDTSPYLSNQFLQMYDVLSDGRFLMFKLESQAPRTEVVIIRNWLQQVTARLAQSDRQ